MTLEKPTLRLLGREAAIVVAGVTVGLSAAWVWWPAALKWQEDRRVALARAQPVLVTRTEVVQRYDREIIVHIVGERLRGDECNFVGRQAYAIGDGGRMIAAETARLDIPERRTTLPVGPHDLGTWRISARPEEGAIVWALYLCDDVDVRSILAFVPRPE